MTQRQHYVSKFHLRGFTDLAAAASPDPWLWLGDIRSGEVVRRSPDNFGWAREMFDGPGALVDRDATLESFLSREVEGPAARALREYTSRPRAERGPIPTPVTQYLAWAAARSLPMATLYAEWTRSSGTPNQAVERPPEGFENIRAEVRTHRMKHPTLGERRDVPSVEVETLTAQGWQLHLVGNDLLELIHLQAWYFQVRHFPRLKWLVLDAPLDATFIIGDRPVVWEVSGATDVPPAALRHPSARVVAPLSRAVALFGYQESSGHPVSITSTEINATVAAAAHDWIAGPSEVVVRHALDTRARGTETSN